MAPYRPPSVCTRAWFRNTPGLLIVDVASVTWMPAESVSVQAFPTGGFSLVLSWVTHLSISELGAGCYRLSLSFHPSFPFAGARAVMFDLVDPPTVRPTLDAVKAATSVAVAGGRFAQAAPPGLERVGAAAGGSAPGALGTPAAGPSSVNMQRQTPQYAPLDAPAVAGPSSLPVEDLPPWTGDSTVPPSWHSSIDAHRTDQPRRPSTATVSDLLPDYSLAQPHQPQHVDPAPAAAPASLYLDQMPVPSGLPSPAWPTHDWPEGNDPLHLPQPGDDDDDDPLAEAGAFDPAPRLFGGGAFDEPDQLPSVAPTTINPASLGSPVAQSDEAHDLAEEDVEYEASPPPSPPPLLLPPPPPPAAPSAKSKTTKTAKSKTGKTKASRSRKPAASAPKLSRPADPPKPVKPASLDDTEPDPPPTGVPPGPRSTARPSAPYAALIGQALLAQPSKQLAVAGICQWISRAYPYYSYPREKPSTEQWTNQIAKNLSIYNSFTKAERSNARKGSLWSIRPECEHQFAGGGFVNEQSHVRPPKTSDAAAVPSGSGSAGPSKRKARPSKLAKSKRPSSKARVLPPPQGDEHECQECGDFLPSAPSLVEHERTVHGSVPAEFVCAQAACDGAAFSSERALTRHCRRLHAETYMPDALPQASAPSLPSFEPPVVQPKVEAAELDVFAESAERDVFTELSTTTSRVVPAASPSVAPAALDWQLPLASGLSPSSPSSPSPSSSSAWSVNSWSTAAGTSRLARGRPSGTPSASTSVFPLASLPTDLNHLYGMHVAPSTSTAPLAAPPAPEPAPFSNESPTGTRYLGGP